jgi:hypothetical protein
MGSNILVICVNIILILDIINILHLGVRDLIIFISVISWRHKVCVIRVIFEITLVHLCTKFLFNGDVKLFTLLLLSWRLN